MWHEISTGKCLVHHLFLEPQLVFICQVLPAAAATVTEMHTARILPRHTRLDQIVSDTLEPTLPFASQVHLGTVPGYGAWNDDLATVQNRQAIPLWGHRLDIDDDVFASLHT